MTAPAGSYWSIDECRWVRYSRPLEIPDQREADEPVATPADEGFSIAAALAAGIDAATERPSGPRS